MLAMKYIEIISCFLATIIGISLAQSCQTPNSTPGNCILISECDHLSKIFNKEISTITPSERELLQRSQCGFQGRQPKVCCSVGPRYTVNDLPVPGICGTQSLKDRVLNGENTTISDYPWMALLEYKRGYTSGFYCGGTIIDENYILTAAHCLKGTVIVRDRYQVISIRLGEHNLLTDQDCDIDECAPPVINIPIAETIVHENYNAARNDDDIALIRVAYPIKFTDWVKPICLPVADKLRQKDFVGVELDVVGFGKTESRSKSDVKLHLRMNGTSLQFCNEAYRKFRVQNINITPKQLCAGGEKGKDSCTGDSGGPLLGEDFLDGFSPYNYLAGIVSFGPTPCGAEGVPGVYVKVSQYIDWIVDHMRH